MAYLANRLSVTQVAWEFDSSVRVFKVPEVYYVAEEEKDEYRTFDGTYGIDFKGVWLSFGVATQYFKEQISGTATDRIDILNALKFSGFTVYFYPDYEGQPLIKYEVKSANSSVQVLRTSMGLFKPAQTINMRAVTRVSNYPDFLRYR